MVELDSPAIMGILNRTPDSFYSGSRFDEKAVVTGAGKMLDEGAAFIDIGGASTRPGAETVSVEEELKRVLPSIKSIIKEFPLALISIDTLRPEVARAAVNEGAAMVNDISGGGLEVDLLETVASLKVPYVLMHIKGTPKTMQANPHYEDVVDEVINYFIEKIKRIKDLNITDVILDPGFGFGKTVAHNYTLLKSLDSLKIFGYPILAGVSRKSMICKVLDVTPEEALNGTTALHVLALLNNADILRVHDVKEAVEAKKIVEYYRQVS
ncbi:MAG TPA: dihydropteroate synthase [Flavobacterium sp.]|nr:dihydropteroate synthase [Flavobacterium sp.]